MQLKLVTITGADDSIEPENLLELQEQYPFAEWGILLSAKQMGNKRFPSLEWLVKLDKIKDKLNLSGHICGKWVRDLLQGRPSIKNEHPFIWNMFPRFQLNFHAEFHQYSDDFLNFAQSSKKSFIIQMDNVNNIIFHDLCYCMKDVEPLFDLSHGAGILPEKWPKPIAKVNLNRYAGGLCPSNLEEQIPKIAEAALHVPFSIDMETKVRSDDDKIFDLNKVRECLSISNKFM